MSADRRILEQLGGHSFIHCADRSIRPHTINNVGSSRVPDLAAVEHRRRIGIDALGVDGNPLGQLGKVGLKGIAGRFQGLEFFQCICVVYVYLLSGFDIELLTVFGAGSVDTRSTVGKKSFTQILKYFFTTVLDRFRNLEIIDLEMQPARSASLPLKSKAFPLEPDQFAFPVEVPGRDVGQLVPAYSYFAQIDVARPVDGPVSPDGSSCT